jgi:hypothetical protein
MRYKPLLSICHHLVAIFYLSTSYNKKTKYIIIKTNKLSGIYLITKEEVNGGKYIKKQTPKDAIKAPICSS